MIAKLEKSELSIHLADKMDNMDRTWKWFNNLLIEMFVRKVRDLSRRVDGKVRILLRIFCYFVHYLAIASVAYITTRDQGDYYAESDLSSHETHVTPSFHYKLANAFVVFLFLSM